MDDNLRAAGSVLLVAHGTRDRAGITAHLELVEQVACHGRELRLIPCWLDVAEPSLADTLATLVGPVVVVPVLLCTGYHVTRDIPATIAARGAAAPTVLTRHLGPDARVVAGVFDRLTQSPGWTPGRPTALVAAGSSDPAAGEELAAAAAQLAELTGGPVTPTTVDGLANLPADIDVASYLLAPGHFADRLRELAPARRVSAPLGAHPEVAALIGERIDEAIATLVAVPASNHWPDNSAAATR